MTDFDFVTLVVKRLPPTTGPHADIEVGVEDVESKGVGFTDALRASFGLQRDQMFTIHKLKQEEGQEQRFPIWDAS